MTWLEKFKKEYGYTANPYDLPCPEDMSRKAPMGLMECPYEGGCEQCYNREVPEEYLTEEEKMPTSATTKKTKAEILEELEVKNTEIATLKKELKDLERYKQYEDSADELAAMKNALVNSGFSDDQAFQLVIEFIKGAAQMSNRKFIV